MPTRDGSRAPRGQSDASAARGATRATGIVLELDLGRGARDAMSSATVGTTAASSSARARRRGNVYDVLGLITDRATRAIDRRRAGLTLRTDVGLDDVTARELGLDLAQSFRRERERRSVVESAVGGVQGVGWGHRLVSEG